MITASDPFSWGLRETLIREDIINAFNERENEAMWQRMAKGALGSLPLWQILLRNSREVGLRQQDSPREGSVQQVNTTGYVLWE